MRVPLPAARIATATTGISSKNNKKEQQKKTAKTSSENKQQKQAISPANCSSKPGQQAEPVTRANRADDRPFSRKTAGRTSVLAIPGNFDQESIVFNNALQVSLYPYRYQYRWMIYG
ncbi:hypothetical protein H6F48_03015 [Limnothrix sp. FACHB-1088]|nr:hypothetical protein [Limnothrix sp. FACHB-1088]